MDLICSSAHLLIICLSVRGRADDLEGAHQSIRHRHHRPRVIKLSAVIGRREDGDQLAVGLELVTVLHHLMRATHQVQSVTHQEVRYHVMSECVGDSSVWQVDR